MKMFKDDSRFWNFIHDVGILLLVMPLCLVSLVLYIGLWFIVVLGVCWIVGLELISWSSRHTHSKGLSID